MGERHPKHLVGIDFAVESGQDEADHCSSEDVLGNRLRSGTEELPPGSRRSLEHSYFEQKFNNSIHYPSLFEASVSGFRPRSRRLARPLSAPDRFDDTGATLRIV